MVHLTKKQQTYGNFFWLKYGTHIFRNSNFAKMYTGILTLGRNTSGQDLILENGIYQRRRTPKGKFSIKMRWYRPYQPNTQLQIDSRNRLKAQVEAWQNLEEREKRKWRMLGKRRLLSGYNYFLKVKLKQNG